MLPSQVALRDSVISHPPANSTMPGPLVFDVVRGPLLPARGTKERDRILRIFDQNDYASNWQGATSGMLKKAAQTKIRIDGPPSKVQYYNDLIGTAHQGKGWEHNVKLGGRDYLTQSYGWFEEIAGPGDPSTPLLEAPTGINHLDAGRCYVTGNPIFPVLYYDLWSGKLHKMHATRVYWIVDDPNPDERYLGIGRCALERAIAIAQREIRMGQYIDALLDDKPQPGILSLTGVSENNWQAKVAQYMTQQSNDDRPVFGRTMVLTSLDPNAKVGAEVIPFSQTPEKFDWIKYMDADLSNYALALGVDRQELAELSGKALGSGAQSQTLASKSVGKFYGDFYAHISRFLNWAVLPDDCEAIVVEDDAQEKEIIAQIDTQYSAIATSLNGIGVPTEVIMKMLAAVSPTFEQAFTDEQGNIIALPKPVAPTQLAPGQTPKAQPTNTAQPQSMGVDNSTPTPSATAQKGFDPSQPRDDQGEWTDTGVSAGAFQSFAQSVGRGGKPASSRSESGSSKPKPKVESRDNAPSDVADSATTYTAGAYHPINEFLRGKRASLSSENQRVMHTLDKAIGKSKLPKDMTLYRGQVMSSAAVSKLTPGTILNDKAFLSTTDSIATANAYTWATTKAKPAAVITRIKAPKGTAALPISDYSRAKSEGEILLPRDTSLKITNVSTRGNTTYLDAEIVNSSIKAYSSTSAEFATRFTDIVTRAIDGRLRRNQAENLMLGLLNSSGTKAFMDGLAEGGVYEMDIEDQSRIQDWLSDTIDYIDPFLDSAFDGTLPLDQVNNRAQMWTNKSLEQMHTSGRLSADRNGMYLFTGKDGAESCPTCKRLKGQVHRFKDWERKRLVPGLNTDTFECGGWLCEHRLMKTAGKAVGNF